MEVVLNKYKILIESDKWNSPSDQDTKIIALSSEIYELKMSGILSKKKRRQESAVQASLTLNGRRHPQKMMNQPRRLWVTSHTTGVFTTNIGPFIHQTISGVLRGHPVKQPHPAKRNQTTKFSKPPMPWCHS